MTQIITGQLYIIVEKEKYKNGEYTDFPRYSYTSIMEAMRNVNLKDGENIVTFSDFLLQIKENSFNAGVDVESK